MRPFLTLLLALTLLTPFTTSAQTSNCTVSNVLFDEPTNYTGPEPFTLSIVPPLGCTAPSSDLANVSITKGGSYLCSGGTSYSDVGVKVGTQSVDFTAKCDKYPNYIESSSYRITVKFGSSDTQAPSYYCNRADPVKPYCDTWTSTSQGQKLSYMQCMSSCVSSRDWVDVQIAPVAAKYKTGQIIEFNPISNLDLSKLKLTWNFGDNITRGPNEQTLAQLVTYTLPGKKNVVLSAFNPLTNKTVSTTTQVNIKCFPPDGSTEDLATINTYFRNYRPVKIPANNLRTFVADNNQAVADSLNYCQNNLGAGDQNPVSLVNATKIIDYYSVYSHQRKMAAPLALAIVTDIDPNLLGFAPSTNPLFARLGRYQPIAFHAEVALDFWLDTSGGSPIYKIKALDPNGPELVTLNCQQKQIKSGPSTFQPILVCDFDYVQSILDQLNIQNLTATQLRDVKNSFKWLVYDPNVTDVTPIDINLLASKAVRKNTAKYLEDNYFLIDNGDPQFGGGVCAAWSTFAINMAYLGNFVGECASTPTAELPNNDNANLASTGLLEFLNSLFDQLLRPIFTN